ncbi:MAG: hypothetical protein K6U74_01410 [Firmicutes bacterium]|nr:hypothetical protein [Bacillota bacterium]
MESTTPAADNSGAQGQTGGIPPAAPAAPAQPVAPPATQDIPPGTDPRTVMKNPLIDLLGASQQTAEPQSQPAGESAPGAVAQPGTTDDITAIAGMIPDKFKNPDRTVNTAALMKSYLGMEKVLGEQGQKLSIIPQLERQIQILQSQLSQVTQQPGQPQTQPQTAPASSEPELTPEQIKEMNEKFLEDFYENPVQTIANMATRIAQDMVNPIAQTVEQSKQVHEFTAQIEDFAEKNPDVADLWPDMLKILDANKHLADLPNGLEVIYKMAKAEKYGTPPPAPPAPPTPEQLLQDPAFRAKILADPGIKNEILKGYVQEIKSGQPPVVIGNQPGSLPPAAPPTEIKNISDAKKASIGLFQRLLGGAR